MSTDSQVRSAAFLAPRFSLPGVDLRTLSAASFLLLKRTKNQLVTPSPDSGGDETEARLAGMMEFIYVHGAPIEDVLRSAELPIPRQCARQLEMPLAEFLALPEAERGQIAEEIMLSRFRAAALAYNAAFPLDLSATAQEAIERETSAVATAIVEPKQQPTGDTDPN